MNRIVKEGSLQFDFSQAVRVLEFDKHISPKVSHCMKCVDFLVEWQNEVWLVEVKDPEDPNIPEQNSIKEYKRFVSTLYSEKLFSQELGPKAKDSFLYLYLSRKLIDKPLKYFVLLGLDSFSDSQLLPLNTPLRRSICLSGLGDKEWTTPYFKAALVFNIRNWNNSFPECLIQRIPGKSTK